MNNTLTILTAALLAITIHEAAHWATARSLGLRVMRLGIDWRGVYLVRERGLPWQNALVSAAGPVANLLTVYVTLRLGYGVHLCFASVVLGAYNLMPLPGSDGLRLAKLMFAAK